MWVSTKTHASVAVMHRDPVIIRNLINEENGKILYGPINFGSQIGLSEFNVLVDGKPEFDFTVEVFPSKLDYASDYEEMLAEVQEILIGLALEYLRSTFKMGVQSKVPQPTNIEWLTLLKNIGENLEKALRFISQHPIRGLVREPISVRIENIKKVDSAIRSAVSRGSGAGEFVELDNRLRARRFLAERQARSTLNTPEHRWLNSQLNRIRQRLGVLRRQEVAFDETERRAKILKELDELEARIACLTRLEPMTSSEGDPPQGFASLQLQGAPGYREAYQNCLILMLGLRIEGDPLRLSVKDLNLLYEYWCYLALLRIVSEEVGHPVDAKRLISIKREGLRVLIQKGRESAVPFNIPDGRRVTVLYNPRFQGDPILVPQQPDMLISFENPDWPAMHFVVDAKYRIDSSPNYVNQYGSPGPPNDAINVLHRYRDAILEQDRSPTQKMMPKRGVVQAAALFPYRETKKNDFRTSRLWQGIEQIGIGAAPFLPGGVEYVSDWLRETLRQGGWALADRAIPHRSEERSREWRAAASEVVLIGVLRSGEKGDEQNNLSWILREKQYYIPFKRTQQRFHVTKWVAIYLPKTLRDPGAITYWAEVTETMLLPRREIMTPWPPRRDADELQVLYHLGEVRELQVPIENTGAEGVVGAFRSHRWTSRLALLRAKKLEELFLETEPEWRLYEDFQTAGISFRIEPGKPKAPSYEDPSGRAFFITEHGIVQYRGAAGYVVKSANMGEDQYYFQTREVLDMLKRLSVG